MSITYFITYYLFYMSINLYLFSIYLEKTEKNISLTYLFDMPII